MELLTRDVVQRPFCPKPIVFSFPFFFFASAQGCKVSSICSFGQRLLQLLELF